MCLYQRWIPNKKYQPNKKNGGNVPAVRDTRTLYVPIDCENCMVCRKRESREWMVRLQEDIKHNPGAKFITLTFSNESIKKLHRYIMEEGPHMWGMKGYELDNKIATVAMRLFNERYRKKHKEALRHWMVTELGHNGTENIHLHGIIWPKCSLDEIEQLWDYGWVWKYKLVKGEKINYVNNRTINYITKYISKRDELHQHYKPLKLSSPGIGREYTHTKTFIWEEWLHIDKKTRNWSLRKYKKIQWIEKPIGNHHKNKFKWIGTNQTYKTSTGHKMSLPKYWRNKIYSDNEREELWLQGMDNETQWICGEKIDTSDGYKNLFDTRDYYRKKNRRLGYGSYHKDEDRMQWEENRRAEKFRMRIQNANKFAEWWE